MHWTECPYLSWIDYRGSKPGIRRSSRGGRHLLNPREWLEGETDVTGTIRTLRTDKGFGFIKTEGGKEYFFHQSAIYGEGIDDLREGDTVEFDVGEGPKGPRAENVRRTST
jgi:cold shock protein